MRFPPGGGSWSPVAFVEDLKAYIGADINQTRLILDGDWPHLGW